MEQNTRPQRPLQQEQRMMTGRQAVPQGRPPREGARPGRPPQETGRQPRPQDGRPGRPSQETGRQGRVSQETSRYVPQNGHLDEQALAEQQTQLRMPAQGRGAQGQMPPQGRGRGANQPEPEMEMSGAQLARQYQGDHQDRSVEALIMKLEDNLIEAKKMPFTEQCVVDREEMLFLLNLLREGLPEELRQAKWLLQKNRELIVETRKEAEKILRDAEKQMAHMINEHEVTQKAEYEAHRILDEAAAQSRQMQNAAIKYVRELLTDVEETLTDTLLNIQKNKKELER